MGEFKKKKPQGKMHTYEQNKDFIVDPQTGDLESYNCGNPNYGSDGSNLDQGEDVGGLEDTKIPLSSEDITNKDLAGISILKPNTNNMDIRDDKISIINYEGLLSGLSDNASGADTDNDGASGIQSSIDDTVKEYTDSIKDYSEYLEGSPTFVTYFRINRKKSTIDTSLGGIVETVGADSPLVYDKIMNVPIWNLEEMLATYSYDEFTGLDTEIQTTGIILPNTIKPRPDEFVYIEYGSRKIILKINSVESTNILSAVFYKINMGNMSTSIDALNAQVGNTLYYDYDQNAIVDGAAIETANALNSILNDIEVSYINIFYNKYYNSFVFNNCYDKFLHRFIHDTHLFIHEKSFMKNIHVEPIIPFNISEATMYDNSIYERIISRRDKEFIQRVHIHPMNDIGNSRYGCGCRGDVNIFNVFSMGRNCMREIDHTPNGKLPIFSDFAFTTTNINSLSYSERIINTYMKTGSTDYTSYLGDLKMLQVEYYLKDYIQIPLIIYILKQVISKIKKPQSN